MFVVAGASGRTGKVVAELLLAQGHRVRALVRHAAAGEALRARGAQIQLASLDDPAAVSRALEGADALYALLPEDAPLRYSRAHRRTLVDVISTALKASAVPHVVLLSAAAASLPDGNGPAAELHYAEHQFRRATRRLSVLRAAYFQENVLGALSAALHEGIYPNFFPSADLALPMVATQDVARVAARCLLGPPARNETIDLVGPTYSARGVADKLGAALGEKQLRVVDVAADEQVTTLMRAGMPFEFASAVAELHACFATGRVRPEGDRMLAGTTTLEETLAGAVHIMLGAARSR